ncbi:hypothetical protein BDW68DRAFT_166705 [Aspergillus falconensis]
MLLIRYLSSRATRRCFWIIDGLVQMLGFVISGNPEDAAPPRPSDRTVPSPAGLLPLVTVKSLADNNRCTRDKQREAEKGVSCGY